MQSAFFFGVAAEAVITGLMLKANVKPSMRQQFVIAALALGLMALWKLIGQ